MPRSLATCAIGRPLSATSRTARSRNSSGYFFGAGIAEVLPLPRTKSWLEGLRQTRPGSMLERVEHLRADVLAAVLIAGRDRTADLAVVGPLAGGVDLARVAVEALDDRARRRALVAEPDRAGDQDDVRRLDELTVDLPEVV